MTDEPQMDWLSQLDQMLASVRDIAKLTRGYYDALIEEGFEPDQALLLAGQFSLAAMGFWRES